jgi:hypothetical protein
MKSLVLYSLAAALYVVGGTFMKHSRGLTRLFPALALAARGESHHESKSNSTGLAACV